MRRSWTKNVRAVLTIAGSLILSACQQEFQAQFPKPIEVGIYAGGTQTRTEMLSNGLSAAWEAGDEIALWAQNSSGSYMLSQQIFKTYGIDASRGFFTSTLSEAMADGTYTYMCCYPVPSSVSGTSVSFSLPALQDGKASGGADIMIATPVSHGPLTEVPDPEDHSGMSMAMNRMMHQFRFWLPDGYDVFNGEGIEEIIVTMPQNIAGTVTADISDPAAAPVLSNGVNMMTLVLADPVGVSADLENASFACAAVFPYSGTYTDADYMNLTVYSQKYKATIDPVSLSGRTFAAGHSTPVRILPASSEEYYRLTMKVGDNYIGEALTNVSIVFDGTPWYTYTNDGTYSNFTHQVEAYGADGKAAYDLIVSEIESGTATYIYETEHALVNRPLTADMMTYDGNRIVLDLGDVPYLLYENFDNAVATSHDDDYTASTNSDMNLGGYLLDGYLPLNGWNAARFAIMEGDCIRINCRYQSGGWVVGRYCGRLDTPALKYLKDGVSVEVVVEFDEAFYVPAGYNRDDSKTAMAKYHVGYHSDSETSAIDGVTSGNISDEATIVHTSDLHASENVANLNPASVTIPSAGPSTRIAFFADTDRSASVIAANSVYYVYLDNIRIYIK